MNRTLFQTLCASTSTLRSRVARRTDSTYPLGLALVLAAFLGAAMTTPTAWAQGAVKAGSWETRGYAVDGDWKIVEQGGKLFLELPETFSTKKAPDLKLFLSPQAPADVSSRNAIEGATLVAALESDRGAQRYPVPVDRAGLARFKTLVLHCEKYSKLWAVGTLE